MSDKLQRRLPKQKRSWQRYHHMLDTAAQLFDKDGVDAVTTNHIADKAEVSIGSLYQFFPNKEAIIEALIERYQQNMQGVFPQQLDTSQPIEHVIRGVLSGFMTFKNEQAGFQAIMVGLAGKPDNEDINNQMHQTVINGIASVLSAYYPQMDDDQRNLCATISYQITLGLMPLETLSSEVIVEQMILAVSAYQRAFVQSLAD